MIHHFYVLKLQQAGNSAAGTVKVYPREFSFRTTCTDNEDAWKANRNTFNDIIVAVCTPKEM